MKHTILGAGGSIGNALTYELLKANENIRLVSRSNYSITGTESFTADISSYEETLNSVQNSDVVYLCAGLAYDLNVWRELWPKIMQNAIIARSADLYGPYATKTCVPYILAIDNLMKGKKAQWLVDVNKSHSFSYTIDCAKALTLLSTRDECYNQVWHMPTYNPGIDGKTFIELAAKEFGVAPKYSVLKKWMVKMVGLFNKTVNESYEMLYQSEFEYYFDSTKFNDFFNFKPTTYQEGIHETIAFLKRK